MAEKHILIVCGEASGDLNAANLAKAIKEINPGIKISGVGGALLRDCGAQIIYDIKGLAVIGLFDALKKLPKFLALQKLILQKIKEDKPDAIILVDFSGFNLRLAKKINLERSGRIDGESFDYAQDGSPKDGELVEPPGRTINRAIPVIYYISPQVWASRQGRIETIKKYIHKMLVLFKFEEEFYKRYGIDADYVGNPLLDVVQPSMNKESFLTKFNLSESKTTIALLPGSRKQEIENILPVMLEASMLISKKLANAQFIIAKSGHVDWDIYSKIIRGINIDLKIIENKTYDCLNIADFCVVTSGTATLETAIMQKPFCIIYKMNLLNYLFYLPQVRVPYIGMVNIVAKRKIIPEFIQFQASPKKISEEAIKILKNPAEIARIKNELAQIKSQLGEKGASKRAAKIIIDFINKI